MSTLSAPGAHRSVGLATEAGLGGRSVEDFLGGLLDWHFDPRTGSPFWLARAAGLGFDPRRDIRRFADLRLFPDVSAELTTVAVHDLVPRGLAGLPVHAFESGGTTGTPKRIVELGARRAALGWVLTVLRQHGFPTDAGVDWLHLGPSGPHIVGRSIGTLARLCAAVCHYVDFDPRWVRRCLAAGRGDHAAEYVGHVLDQANDVLRSQRVGVLFVTPAVLEAATGRPELLRLLQQSVRGLIWSGTSMSEQTLRCVQEELFPDAVVVSIYGNSLMGIAPQRPPRPTDPHRCVYQPFYPQALVHLVDEHGEQVPDGATGRVRVNLLSRDLLLPNVLERDSAVRVAAADDGDGGLAAVRPYRGQSTAAVIEGVY